MAAYKKVLSFILSDPLVEAKDIFDLLWRKLEDEYASRRYSSVDALKQQACINKEKGTLFEILCVDLLKRGVFLKRLNIVEVYKLSDLSDDLKIELGITTASGKPTKKDMGIDIFAKCGSGDWLAVQCKYLQKPTRQKFTPKGAKVPWMVACGSLSSFYDICSRTGPKSKNNSWLYNVVMTNCLGVRRRAKRGEKDVSICHGKFSGLSRDIWYNLCGYVGNKLSEPLEQEKASDTPKEPEPAEMKGFYEAKSANNDKDIKELRNAFLDRLVKN